VDTWAEGPKRPEGGERNERWARPAPAAKIERPGKAGRYECIRRACEPSEPPDGWCERLVRRKQLPHATCRVSCARMALETLAPLGAGRFSGESAANIRGCSSIPRAEPHSRHKPATEEHT